MNYAKLQDYMRSLPSPGLQEFVDRLEPGRHRCTDLFKIWLASPLCDDTHKRDRLIFRAAIRKAGMQLTDSRWVTKL